MDKPTVSPTPEQMFSFPTYEEAKRAQNICLTEPIPKVEKFLQSLESDVRCGRVVYVRPENPDPPTRGETMWLDGGRTVTPARTNGSNR
jgi:hypothetical protein